MAEKNTGGRAWVRKLKKFFKWTGLMLLGAMLAAYSYVRFDVSRYANRLEEEMAEAKALGVPLTPEEMDRRSKIPDAENAAILYEAADIEFSKNPLSKEHYYLLGWRLYEVDPVARAKARQIMAKVEPDLRRYREAFRRPECAMKIDWSDPNDLGTEQWTYAKLAARWFAVDAPVAALDGDWNRALDSLRALGAITGHMGQERLFIGAMYQIAIQQIGYAVVEYLAWQARDDSEVLRRLHDVVEAIPEPKPVEYYLKGEAFYGYWFDRNLSVHCEEMQAQPEGELGDLYGFELHPYQVFPPLIERNLMELAYASQYLKYWNESLRSVAAGDMRGTEIWTELDRVFAKVEAESKPWMRFNAAYHSPMLGIGNAFDQAKARKLCTVALIEALEWNSRNGRLPKSLQEAGIQSLDPFDKIPLKFKTTNSGFRIYSIGPDGIDEMGRATWDRALAGSRRSDDIMASFPYRGHGDVDSLKKDRELFNEGLKRVKAKLSQK